MLEYPVAVRARELLVVLQRREVGISLVLQAPVATMPLFALARAFLAALVGMVPLYVLRACQPAAREPGDARGAVECEPRASL